MPVSRKPTVTTEKVASLRVDENILQRGGIDAQRTNRIAEAVRSGKQLPPLLVDRKGRRIVDGVHRQYVYERLLGPEAECQVEWREYPNDAAAFSDGASINAAHGMPLSSMDLAHCILVGKRLDIPEENLAEVLGLTLAKIQKMTAERFGVGPDGQQVLLKRSSRHLAGKSLSKKQVAGNARASGMSVMFHVNQVINALENGIAPLDEHGLLPRLRYLAKLIPPMDEGDGRKSA